MYIEMHKILVVDDQPTQTQVMCHILSILDIECIVAHSGREAVQLAKNQQPDLILMDWIMPAETLTGNAAIQEILADEATRHIPVIACSAVIDLSQAMSAGCVDYVQKPFDPDQFLDKIRRHLS